MDWGVHLVGEVGMDFMEERTLLFADRAARRRSEVLLIFVWESQGLLLSDRPME